MLISPINPSDKNQVEGIYAKKKAVKQYLVVDEMNQEHEISGFIGGNEGVGQVIEVGTEACSGGGAVQAINGELEVGDWVLPVNNSKIGTWTNMLYSEPSSLYVIKNKEGLIPEQIGSIKVNASTSYRMLKDIVDLQPGDYVMQNGANSGVGQSLIQLARLWGYKTINVVRDRPDFDQLETYLKGLGADIIIKEANLGSEQTKQLLASLASKPKLAINCVGGRAATQMCKYLAPGANFVTYGAMARQPLSIPAGMLIFSDLCFRGFWVTRWYETHSHTEWSRMWDDLLQMMSDGSLVHQKMVPFAWPSTADPESQSNISLLQSLVTEAMTSPTKNYFKF
ncbi:hypothetical protein BB561_000504 [Smittium simulii]|uniref:Alcohol dehydrogenase-like C-terminal domain-containing protein n=1 Tax=Smittium simulii TaxID=133385 RepID=A0A2T9YYT1_9FUNG|nr:hypothetical protein BB561_000504 [Smittium simulii]